MAEFEYALISELLAVNQTVNQLLDIVAGLSGERGPFLSTFLEQGLAGIAKTNLLSVPESDRQGVYDVARARFQDIVSGVSV
jgi:hypothetical protein